MSENLTSQEEESADLIRNEGESVEAHPEEEFDQRVQWAELIGSSFLFASAYLILYIFYDFVTALVAAHFGLEPVLFYDTITYDNTYPDGATKWYPHCIKRVFSFGAIVMGLLGVLFYGLYLSLRKSFVFVRLFMLWGSLISFAILGQRLMAIPFAGNFDYRKLDSLGFELAIFTSYSYFKPSTEWAMGFLGFLLMIAIGLFYAKPFLQTAWSSKQIGSEKERYTFLRYQVILPSFFGSILVTVVLFPVNLVPNSIAFVASILCLLVMIIHAMLMGSFKIPRQKTWERWPIVPTIVFVLVIYLIKTTLTNPGIAIPDLHLYDIFSISESDF
jgi:hypothetical protein